MKTTNIENLPTLSDDDIVASEYFVCMVSSGINNTITPARKVKFQDLIARFSDEKILKEASIRLNKKIKPKSEFDIIIEEQKKVFDSDLKKKIEQIIFTKKNAIVALKTRLDLKVGTDYHIEKDYQKIGDYLSEIRTLQEIIK